MHPPLSLITLVLVQSSSFVQEYSHSWKIEPKVPSVMIQTDSFELASFSVFSAVLVSWRVSRSDSWFLFPSYICFHLRAPARGTFWVLGTHGRPTACGLPKVLHLNRRRTQVPDSKLTRLPTLKWPPRSVNLFFSDHSGMLCCLSTLRAEQHRTEAFRMLWKPPFFLIYFLVTMNDSSPKVPFVQTVAVCHTVE